MMQIIIYIIIIYLTITLFFVTNKGNHYYKLNSVSKANWILIKDSFIDQYLCQLCHDKYKMLQLTKENDEYVERYTHTTNMDKNIQSICTAIQSWMSSQVGRPVILNETIPVQYRQYRQGSFMSLHQDALPDETNVNKKQSLTHYEVVVTLFDDSDSYFYYFINDNYCIKKTQQGDVVVVTHNGILHGVTKSTKGTRAILKISFIDA